MDFANCFKLDPMGEIMLKSMGEMWLRYMQDLQLFLVGSNSEIRLNPMGEMTLKYILTLQNFFNLCYSNTN